MKGLRGFVALLLCGAVAPACAQDWSKMPELQARAEIASAVAAAYRANRLDQLDAEMSRYVHDRSRTSSGLWVSGIYADAVGDAIVAQDPQTAAEWDALERRTLQWTKQRPASALARLEHASVIVRRAWAIRGYGFAASVSDASWKPFHDHLRRADAYLLKQKRLAATLPEYYETRIGIATALGRPRAEVEALLLECDRLRPAYYPAYFAVLAYLLPKWHGDADEVEAFARAAVKRTHAAEGDSMYARIYWVASQGQYYEGLFTASGAQWALMRSGFEDVVKRYPDAWNYQNYAHFACAAGDDRTLQRLLAHHVRAPISPAAWIGELSYEECGRRVGRLSL